MRKTDLSVVIAIYNEQDNIIPLYKRLKAALSKLKTEYEIIFVDDGSTDQTKQRLEGLKAKVIRLRRNYGQTTAWKAGFDHSKGNIIVTMDGDLQNRPEDIPKLLRKLGEGFDVVSGRRVGRKNGFGKKLFSSVAYRIRKIVLFDGTRDAGCALKAYKRKVVEDIELFGDLHRHITTIAFINGYKIGEVDVLHNKRHAGKTKYGVMRLSKGLLDLFFLRFWHSYSTKPLHFFGFLGFVQYLLALLVFVEQLLKAFFVGSFELGPLLVLGVLLFVTGTLFIVIGFMAEILTRIYFKNKKPYEIERIVEDGQNILQKNNI